MKAVIIIELDDKHLILQTNDLYDRLQGYNSDLRRLPERRTEYPHDEYSEGWNACLDELLGTNRPRVIEVK